MPEHTESQIDHLNRRLVVNYVFTSVNKVVESLPTSEINRWIWNGGTSTELEGIDAIIEVGRMEVFSANRLGCRERCYNVLRLVLVVEGDIKVLHNQASLFKASLCIPHRLY